MWTSTSMTVGESLILSCMGLLVVVSALACLAIIIVLFSRAMELTAKKATALPATAASASAPQLDVEPGTAAIILSVICEELHAAPNEINITDIHSVK